MSKNEKKKPPQSPSGQSTHDSDTRTYRILGAVEGYPAVGMTFTAWPWTPHLMLVEELKKNTVVSASDIDTMVEGGLAELIAPARLVLKKKREVAPT